MTPSLPHCCHDTSANVGGATKEVEVTDEGTHMTNNHGREDSCPNYEQDEPAVLEPVDLTFLSDRARAYVIGLEAKIREIREQRDEWKARFESGEADKKGMDASYRKGWEDASSLLYVTVSEAHKKLTELLPKANTLNELTPYYALSPEQMRKVREIFLEIDAEDGAEEALDA